MSIARDRANRVGSDPLVIGSSKISSNDSADLVVQDTSNNPKRLITSEVQIGANDNDKIIIKRNSSTGKVNLQTISGGGSPADQPTGGLTIYSNTSDLPASADEGVMALVTANNFMYIYKSGWYKVAEITNANPTVSSAGNATYSFATDGTPVSIEVTASDPEGVPLQYKYTVTSGSLTNGGGATAAVTSSATSGGTYSALAVNTLTSNKYFKITPSTNSSYAGAFSLTFHASDGVNVANSSASSFTLQFSYDIEILLVGGGGSGGKAGASAHQSGGGGGGGVIHSGTYTYTPGTQLDIVVGAGGAGIAASNSTNQIGNAGTASSIQVNGAGSTYISLARGGGAGGAGNLMTTNEVGGNGANGGGGYAAGGIDDPGMGYGINGVEVAGFHGANNSQSGGSATHSGGGGGGAGGDATNNNGANGEGGYDAWGQATNKGEINGGVYRFGAGGGGASYWDYNANSTGGNGGGGGSTNASGQVFTGQDGQANTGGGGGGGGGRAGSGGDVAGASGAGGSGVVIIRYAGAAKNSQGDSVHTSGGYTYHVYSSTGSATYTG